MQDVNMIITCKRDSCSFNYEGECGNNYLYLNACCLENDGKNKIIQAEGKIKKTNDRQDVCDNTVGML